MVQLDRDLIATQVQIGYEFGQQHTLADFLPLTVDLNLQWSLGLYLEG